MPERSWLRRRPDSQDQKPDERRGCVILGSSLMAVLGILLAVGAIQTHVARLDANGMSLIALGWAAGLLIPVTAMAGLGNLYTARRCLELPRAARILCGGIPFGDAMAVGLMLFDILRG